MFGTIAVDRPAIDVECQDLIGAIIREAQYHTGRIQQCSGAIRRLGAEIPFNVHQGWSRERLEARLCLMAATRPLRATIAARTRQEHLQADHMVRTGNARFLEVACAGETCGDCDRPLRHHIVTNGTRQLCPFGREYWTLARTITGFMIGRPGYAAQSTIGIIARG